MTLLIDSGVAYAYVHRKDARHEAAKEIIREMMEGRWGSAFMTQPLAIEFLNLARARGLSPSQENAAMQFLFGTDEVASAIQVVPLDPSALERARPLFVRLRERRGFSFTDATTLGVMQEGLGGTFATFDSAFRGLVATVGV
ncbi:MAG: type II toxin-antitoxin system VapC family toxin [Thermoplasmatota archaeon]